MAINYVTVFIILPGPRTDCSAIDEMD